MRFDDLAICSVVAAFVIAQQPVHVKVHASVHVYFVIAQQPVLATVVAPQSLQRDK